ncbi:DNA primase [Actinobaculum suis]|uniref:DNA primase n=1 Tax=Actinobaculum suis TaxID=1657 RepID=UPI00066FC3C9|nr:DNA primase [Actinobaculum suis]KMY23798.1 DNA primase [Actinobaculum suis]
MAGLIRREDIDLVRGTARIDEIVSQYVTLKPSGMDSFLGLCPFHDEKTPSFHVRPNHGRYHCFGCGEDGDVISFVQKIESIGFVEAVELLARRYGIELHYEEGGPQRKPGEPRKIRLIDAHRVAIQFYRRQFATPEAAAARQMLAERGFDEAAMDHFQVGFSRNEWDGLTSFLRQSGFSDKEILAAGLASQGKRGLYDRFRGRLMWPIYSITGEPVGFGARRVSEDDKGPKYLNTPETSIYHKSSVLYGLNLAKQEVSRKKEIVIVEGYTDVMAAHLAGIKTAVATCGTAFGEGHIRIVRRLLGDAANPAAGVSLRSGGSYGGEVIFTFDGDEAGKKAALRAFEEDQSFAAQTFVAISPGGMDPCEVRQKMGDAALREVVASRRPLFEFAIRTMIDAMPLDTAEGRTMALRAGAPIVAGIRDRVLRGEYTRNLAGWLGMEEPVVQAAVAEAARQPSQSRERRQSQLAPARPPRSLTGASRGQGIANPQNQRGGQNLPGGQNQRDGQNQQGDSKPQDQQIAPGSEHLQTAPNPQQPQNAENAELVETQLLPARREIRETTERVEHEALNVYLQLPAFARAAEMDSLPSQTFAHPLHRRIHEAIREIGGTQAWATKYEELVQSGASSEAAERAANADYIAAVSEQAGPQLAPAVSQLAAEALPEDSAERLPRYVWGITLSLIRQGIERQITEVRSALQRTNPADATYEQLFGRLMELEAQRRACEEQIN